MYEVHDTGIVWRQRGEEVAESELELEGSGDVCLEYDGQCLEESDEVETTRGAVREGEGKGLIQAFAVHVVGCEKGHVVHHGSSFQQG